MSYLSCFLVDNNDFFNVTSNDSTCLIDHCISILYGTKLICKLSLMKYECYFCNE